MVIKKSSPTRRKRTTKSKRITWKEKYKKHITSPYWKAVRTLALIRNKRKCKRCGATRLLHVHHLTYKHMGKEHLYMEDLITLCKSCHDKEHGKL